MNPIIPLFPLSAHLLPGGRLPLRIFEPRYVRMVKEACANNTGIGICMLNAKGDKALNQHIFPIGTYARVVDFDLLPDGMLGITVEGERCFNIIKIETEKDELRVGECEWLSEWTLPKNEQLLGPINERLIEIFEKYQELKNLYEKPHFDDPIWVIYRWLELLPVNAEQKQQLLQNKDCVKALTFLTHLVE
jgi:uncharacterized protein